MLSEETFDCLVFVMGKEGPPCTYKGESVLYLGRGRGKLLFPSTPRFKSAIFEYEK